MEKHVTIEDIAQRVHKSKGLVSLALSNKYGVSEETRTQIILEAVKMGYPITKKKQNCSNKSNRKAHILLAFCFGMLLDEFYWSRVVSSIEQTLHQQGAIVSFMEWDGTETADIIVALFRSEYDGIIIVGSPKANLADSIGKIGCPIVFVDSSYISCDYTQVKADNYTGGYLLAEYLFGLGHKHLAFWGDTSVEETLSQRKNGVARFAEKNGRVQIDFLSAKLENGLPEYCSITQLTQYLKRQNHASVIICANDAIASKAYEVIDKAGLKIPQDISVVGFDNTKISEWLSPKLTTVCVNVRKIGETAAKHILQYVKEDAKDFVPMRIEIATSIVARDSVKKLK